MTSLRITRRGRENQGERGQAAAETLLVGVLALTTFTFLIIRAWAVVDMKFRVLGAAREAARAYVEAPSADSAQGRATAAGTEAMDGRNGISITVSGGFERCGRITATARATVPAIKVWVVRVGTVTVTGVHSEVVDPYRGGRSGEANCDG
jgi:hypothetical protein